MSDQLELELVLDHYLTYTTNEPVADFPPNEKLPGPPPSKAFIASVAKWGIAEPVKTIRYRNGWMVIDGTRRIKAARALGLETIRATHFEGMPVETALRLRAVYNTQRSANDIGLMNAALVMARKGASEKEIAAGLSTTIQTVRRLLVVSNAPQEILQAVEYGRCSMATAERVARLNGRAKRAVAILTKNGKLTATDVAELRSAQAVDAGAALSLPGMPQPALREVFFVWDGETDPTYAFDLETADEKAQQFGGRVYRGVPV